MTHTTNGDVLRRAVEAFVGIGADSADELFTEDVSGWSPNLLIAGRAELVEAMADIDTALSNVTIHIDAVDGFANKAVAEYRLTGTLNRPGYPGGSLPWKRGWSYGKHRCAAEAAEVPR